MAFALAPTCGPLAARTARCSAFRQSRRSTLGARRIPIAPRASKEDESPLQAVADKIDDAAQGLVEKTKENSGLDFSNLGTQPGKSEANEINGDIPEVMSFAGLAPEIINGRGAMIGMLAALGAELRTHEPVFVQIQKTPVLILGAFLTIIVASIIPIVRGADLNRKGAGPFTPRAEVYNGRLAMVAFALLIAVETWKAGPGLVP